MNTGMMELSMNEMGAVSGGTCWDRLKKEFGWKDAVGILLFGPFGELKAAGKLIAVFAVDED